MEVINQVVLIKLSQSWQPLPSLQLHSSVFWRRIRILLCPEVVLGCAVDPVGHGFCASSSDPTWEHQGFWRNPSSLLLPGIFLGYSGSFLALPSPHTLKPHNLNELFITDVQQLLSFLWNAHHGHPWLFHIPRLIQTPALSSASAGFSKH